jgi:hypothetical protein
MESKSVTVGRRVPWNKSRLTGQRPPLGAGDSSQCGQKRNFDTSEKQSFEWLLHSETSQTGYANKSALTASDMSRDEQQFFATSRSTKGPFERLVTASEERIIQFLNRTLAFAKIVFLISNSWPANTHSRNPEYS